MFYTTGRRRRYVAVNPCHDTTPTTMLLALPLLRPYPHISHLSWNDILPGRILGGGRTWVQWVTVAWCLCSFGSGIMLFALSVKKNSAQGLHFIVPFCDQTPTCMFSPMMISCHSEKHYYTITWPSFRGPTHSFSSSILLYVPAPCSSKNR